MSIFGKILAEVVEGACDVAELGLSITADVVKSPIRLMNRLDPQIGDPDDFTENTQEAIKEIRSK